MDDLITVVFPDEQSAHDGAAALHQLSIDGQIGLYGLAVVRKNADGTVETTSVDDPGPWGTLAGTSFGALIGAFAGPVGVVLGAATGTAAGVGYDLTTHAISHDYVADVQRTLTPGNAAVVSGVVEDSTDLVDREMQHLRGVVFRQSAADWSDAQDASFEDSVNADLDRLEATMARVATAERAKVAVQIDNLRARREHALQAKRASAAAADAERQAKLAYLEAKSADSDGAATARQLDRIAQLRNEYQQRSAQPVG